MVVMALSSLCILASIAKINVATYHQYIIYITYKANSIIYNECKKKLRGVTTIKLKHVLIAGGIVLVIIGHLGDGTATREVAFWLESC